MDFEYKYRSLTNAPVENIYNMPFNQKINFCPSMQYQIFSLILKVELKYLMKNNVISLIIKIIKLLQLDKFEDLLKSIKSKNDILTNDLFLGKMQTLKNYYKDLIKKVEKNNKIMLADSNLSSIIVQVYDYFIEIKRYIDEQISKGPKFLEEPQYLSMNLPDTSTIDKTEKIIRRKLLTEQRQINKKLLNKHITMKNRSLNKHYEYRIKWIRLSHSLKSYIVKIMDQIIKVNNQYDENGIKIKQNLSEEACRSIFEELFGMEFINCRPHFLQKLELDGYCKELNLAFEYQGKQHYEYVPHFHRNGEQDFYNQVIRDMEKKELCKLYGIKLIEVPYKYDYSNRKQMKDYILNEVCKTSFYSEAQ